MKKNKVTVASPVLEPSPQLNKIISKLVVDSPIYQPEKVGNCLLLKAKLTEPLKFAYRTTVKIDCGINLEIPAGWVLKAVASEELTNRGFLLSTAPVKSGRIFLTGINVGKEILAINPQEAFALLSAEPIYVLDWEL